jgi:ketosteroid isomerase-like protein
VGSQNVEIARRLARCFGERDNATAFELLDPEIVWDAREAGIPGLGQIYHGHEGVRSFWRGWLDAWDEIDYDFAEPVELDAERVVVPVTRQRNRGRGTGIWVDNDPYEMVWTIRDGKAVAMEYHWPNRH